MVQLNPGPQNLTQVNVQGTVHGVWVGLTITAQPGTTIEQIKKQVFNEAWIKTGTFYMNAVTSTGVLVRVGTKEMVANLPQFAGAVHLEVTPNGR